MAEETKTIAREGEARVVQVMTRFTATFGDQLYRYPAPGTDFDKWVHDNAGVKYPVPEGVRVLDPEDVDSVFCYLFLYKHATTPPRNVEQQMKPVRTTEPYVVH